MTYMLILSTGIALVVSLIMGPLLIPKLHQWKFGQNIRLDGPQHHLRKAGTPTVGGIIILIAVVVAVGVCAFPLNMPVLICLLSFVLFGVLGGLDDVIKIVKKRNLGLTAKQKLFGQFVLVGVILALAAWAGRGTDMVLPFVQGSFEMGWLYYPFTAVLLVGMINAVNLTDGLDGLASGSVIFSASAFYCIALILWTRGVNEAWEIAIFAAALVGACFGFLRFNAYPAQVFMGDCGSLALGGALAALAVMTRTEILFLLVGFIYVVELLSVVLQVLSFKARGKRIFRMSPLHHHFELGGWSEQKVVAVFWGCSFVAATVSAVVFFLA
ncbi:MAG: phospho-N-acetylmuramoyl-pentapeptide-transferase [Peptococcaceae bacterium]|nr:phospho-N-acetylmuramoyl-pentapeptide-transferase [Peptococcaceae bacterium]